MCYIAEAQMNDLILYIVYTILYIVFIDKLILINLTTE